MYEVQWGEECHTLEGGNQYEVCMALVRAKAEHYEPLPLADFIVKTLHTDHPEPPELVITVDQIIALLHLQADYEELE